MCLVGMTERLWSKDVEVLEMRDSELLDDFYMGIKIEYDLL